MGGVFRKYPEAMANTVRIAERVHMSLDVKGYQLPKFPPPPGRDLAEHFTDIVRKGLQRRLDVMAPAFAAKQKKHEPQEDWDRLESQIGIIHAIGVTGHFLFD